MGLFIRKRDGLANTTRINDNLLRDLGLRKIWTDIKIYYRSGLARNLRWTMITLRPMRRKRRSGT